MDYATVHLITERADKMGIRTLQNCFFDFMSIGDLLDLDGLLKADNFNFSHDIMGIACNLNHATGTFDNFFIPRFMK